MTRASYIAELTRRAADCWGADAQVDVAIEEMAELTNALIKHRRKRVPATAVIEEIADVILMMEQMRFLFGSVSVEKMLDAKIYRLATRVEAELTARGQQP